MATYVYFSFSHSIDCFFLGAIFLSHLTVFRRLIVDPYVLLLLLFFLFVLLNFSYMRQEKGKKKEIGKIYMYMLLHFSPFYSRTNNCIRNQRRILQSISRRILSFSYKIDRFFLFFFCIK